MQFSLILLELAICAHSGSRSTNLDLAKFRLSHLACDTIPTVHKEFDALQLSFHRVDEFPSNGDFGGFFVAIMALTGYFEPKLIPNCYAKGVSHFLICYYMYRANNKTNCYYCQDMPYLIKSREKEI